MQPEALDRRHALDARVQDQHAVAVAVGPREHVPVDVHIRPPELVAPRGRARGRVRGLRQRRTEAVDEGVQLAVAAVIGLYCARRQLRVRTDQSCPRLAGPRQCRR